MTAIDINNSEQIYDFKILSHRIADLSATISNYIAVRDNRQQYEKYKDNANEIYIADLHKMEDKVVMELGMVNAALVSIGLDTISIKLK